MVSVTEHPAVVPLSTTSAKLGVHDYLRKGILPSRGWYRILPVPVACSIMLQHLPVSKEPIAVRCCSPGRGVRGSKSVGIEHLIRFVESPRFRCVFGNALGQYLYNRAAAFPIPIVLAQSVDNVCQRGFMRTLRLVTSTVASRQHEERAPILESYGERECPRFLGRSYR